MLILNHDAAAILFSIVGPNLSEGNIVNDIEHKSQKSVYATVIGVQIINSFVSHQRRH